MGEVGAGFVAAARAMTGDKQAGKIPLVTRVVEKASANKRRNTYYITRLGSRSGKTTF